MIPADIKEMAKRRPRGRNPGHGRAKDVVRGRIKKASLGLVIFVVIWGYYLVRLFLVSQSETYQRNPYSMWFDIFAAVLYLGPLLMAWYHRRKLKRLQERIDAGEFSAD